MNNREEQLLMIVDEKYDYLFFKEELIKKYKKLPKKIELSLENGKNVNKFWNEHNKLSSLINDCINIEKNIEHINEINEKILKGKANINLKIYQFIKTKLVFFVFLPVYYHRIIFNLFKK